MRSLDKRSSLIAFWQHVIFTEAALAALPETEGLAAGFTKLLEDFQGLQAAEIATRRVQLQAQARAFAADSKLDDGIRRLHSDALEAVGQDREAPALKAIFKSDLAGTIRFALSRQLEVTRELVAALGADGIPKALTHHIVKLETLIGAGKAAADQRKAAKRVRMEHLLTADEWKDDVNALRLSTLGALLAIAAKSKRPKAWADGFFAKAEDNGEDIDIDTDASASPNDGSAPVSDA